ncbi:MAG TPA: hypothetical protein PK514_00275 [Spirochaetota bacterium]|nr:hypothetical protein [Spirochaetota bacterium]
MIKRYLNADPIPWLIDGTDPAAVYLAKKEFCEECGHTEIYHELETSVLTGYFKSISTRNILGDKKNPDLINRGNVWFFLWAVECGYNSKTDFIRETSDFISENFLTPDGGFSLSLKPRLPLACRTGDLVRAMLKAGINDERTTFGLHWISQHQRHDGGWLHCPFSGFCDVMKMFLIKHAGSGISREVDTSIPSCPVATLSCIRALSVSGISAYIPRIETGAAFLLGSSALSSTDRLLYCGLNLHPQKSGYPVMTQFDSITALMEIFNTTLWNDAKCAGLFNNIMKKQTADGRWKLENNSRGMTPEGKGENRLVTLNVMRLLKRLSEKES